MFIARLKWRSGTGKRAEPHANRKAARLNTLERRYGFHRDEAITAALDGSHDKAAKHSGTALSISRELCAAVPDPAQHQPELAAALSAHAPYHAKWQAIEMLTESAGLYAALATAEPAVYEVPRIDVLARVAVAADSAGATRDTIDLLHEVVGMYLKAPAADTGERDLGLAQARFHLGRCLLKTGMGEEGLAETDTGLELAADVLDRLELPVNAVGWLGTAPRYLKLAAPEWEAAAVRSMTLHADAARWRQAATSGRAAVLISGSLAGICGEARRDAHVSIAAQMAAIESQVIASQTASCSMRRLRERSTSASAEARSDQCEPSTDLPGSKSL